MNTVLVKPYFLKLRKDTSLKIYLERQHLYNRKLNLKNYFHCY